MKATFFKGIAIGAVVSSATLIGSAAFAGSGVNAAFNLGRTNSVNSSSALAGATNGSQLVVRNTGTGSHAAGISIETAAGKPALTVSSATKVTHLNADLLDGHDTNEFALRSLTNVVGINHFVGGGESTEDSLSPSPAHAGVDCRHVNGNVQFVIGSFSAQGATLNWMFSQGGTSSTVNASGVSLDPGEGLLFALSGTRLEGEFIWADPDYVVTVHVHIFSAGALSGCEIRGTAEIAKTS